MTDEKRSNPLPEPEHALPPELARRFDALEAGFAELTEKVDRLLSLAMAYADEQQDFRARMNASDARVDNLAARVAHLEPIPPPPPNGNADR